MRRRIPKRDTPVGPPPDEATPESGGSGTLTVRYTAIGQYFILGRLWNKNDVAQVTKTQYEKILKPTQCFEILP